MFSIGPGSVCDVCLESFGTDLKAPCSIDCGHVFCLECLNHMSRAACPTICPLCRTPFALGTYVKLHVDVDNAKGPLSQQQHPTDVEGRRQQFIQDAIASSGDTATLQKGRQLQDAIAAVANRGSSEPGLCQLIADCKSFLASHPQEFQDLRVSYRMVNYIYEIKSRLRDKERAVEAVQANIEALQAEKAELADRLSRAESQRREDREAALAVEMSLRHHCEQTQASYTELVKLYHQAVARIDKIQSAPQHHVPEEWEYRQQPKAFKSSPESSSTSSLSPPSQDFLISPLPEFTSTGLPSINAFSPLPEDDLACNKETRPCGTTGCPFTCNCQPVSLFRQIPAQDHQVFAPSPSPSPPSGPPTGLLSMTAPHKRMEENTRTNTRSQSFSAVSSRTSSRPPTCPSSPKPETSTVSSTSGVGIPVPRDPDRLRTRLRDLLDPNSPSMSASLPNLSSSSSSSPAVHSQHSHVNRGENRYTTPTAPVRRSSRSPPPRSESTASSLSHSVSSLGDVPSSLSSSLTTPSVVYSSVTATRQGTTQTLSHASAAAQALERVQKEERRSAVKEKEREKERSMTMNILPQNNVPPPVSISQGRPDRPTISRSSTQSQTYMVPQLQASPSNERLAPQSRSQPIPVVPPPSSSSKERSSSVSQSGSYLSSKPTTMTTMVTSSSSNTGTNNINNTSSNTSLSRESSRRNHQQSSIGPSKGKVISTTTLHSLTTYA